MFIKVGGVFKYKYSLYRVIENCDCCNCAFYNSGYDCVKLKLSDAIPRCGYSCRIDKKSVIFVKLKTGNVINLD